ncbi:prolactin receptor b [Periophthalmus magnuspinnatus]|uniref:prolactin receptor b n=1 Tax=Periophthalmus magnuspinnatus TaxID=409849 RepID=UPI00145AD8AE|nr:prolactin receptor b [Periophthalmus magnuspinnatus]
MTDCTRLKRLLGWVLLLLISAVFECSSNSPPGKPVFKDCHSPDKETFTCWWEPDPDDGEDTTYRLFYEKDQEESRECPDYHTAGKNSCFFDRNHTSIWVDYFLTVVAFNAFGNASSDIFKLDVVDIVKGNPPENVTVRLEFDQDSPTIHVYWNPYVIRSNYGWLTTKYQLRFKEEDGNWTMQNAGLLSQFRLYNASPGKQYTVQVRCSIDNGKWSEWSSSAFIQIPKSEPKQQRFWIPVAFFSAIPFFAAVCILYIKWKFIKQWLLPPVPGPKIKGVDVHLLKSGRSEEVTSALLINQVFPSVTPWKNQVEEYLVVRDDNLLIFDGLGTNGVIISSKFHSEANINEESNVENNVDHKEEAQILDYFVEINEPGFVDELNFVNAMETEKVQSINDLKVVPLENSSYVDIPKKDVTVQDMRPGDYSTVQDIRGECIILEKQSNTSDSKNTDMNRHEEERLPDDYTKVKEVKGDHIVLLQDPSCGNNGQYTDCGNHKSPHPMMEKGGVYADFLHNGYVDNISTTPVM